ncbi:hypothetical protein Scep_030650 [Stephania cephalantha]|uniref:MIF4G domain-containing protein n=1 Tax=Stephania cephalantha TaxID=152367 RepID=A0AAP0HEI9_9MAGN
MSSSWKPMLLRIGDKCAEYGGTVDFKEHIETCYGVVWRELEHSSDEVLEYVLQCVEQLPHKIPLYGTLVGLLNLESEEFTKNLVERTHSNLQVVPATCQDYLPGEFQEALDSGSCDRIRILMRFLMALMCSKILQTASVVEIFESFLSSAATTLDEAIGNPCWQACADFYVSCILSCLPWGGAELFEQVPEEVERVMVGVESYLRIRKPSNDADFSVFEFNAENDKAIDQKDFLEDLWERIKVLSNNGWKVDSVPRPHLLFEAQLVAGKSYSFEPISCPDAPEPPRSHSGIDCDRQKHAAELNYLEDYAGLIYFLQDLQPIDRFVVEEYLLDVLLFSTAAYLTSGHVFEKLVVLVEFIGVLFKSFGKDLKDLESTQSIALNQAQWKSLNPLILLLPQPPFKPMYYTLVIIDLCKALPGAFPAVVAGAVRALFEKIADLDMECRTRLVLWFSHHLSNFQFIWPWEEWAFVLALPKWAPQRVFVQEVLEREVRLSYWDKIKQSVENAPELEELLPPKVGSNFRYSTEDGVERTSAHEMSMELGNMVKGRKTAREITLWIEEKIILFMVIGKLCPDQEKQMLLMDEVNSYWKNSAQMTAIAIDRMMGYRLISNLAIVSWVFSSSNIELFHTSDRLWSTELLTLLNMILRNAIDKTCNRFSDLRKEVSSLEKSVLSASESASKAKADLDAAEAKLSLVNGEPVQGENPVRLKRLKSYAEKAKEHELSVQESHQAKVALFSRALEENEALFVSLYKSFSVVLTERLPSGSAKATLRDLRGQTDNMVVDIEESLEMEVDKDNDEPKKSNANGEKSSKIYNIGEKEQWCLTTLGYVKSLSRQYAAQIWLHIERLDAVVFSEDVHPLFRASVYSGLRRPLHEV